MNYENCLDYINSLGRFSAKPGLEKIKYLCGLFDNPQENYAGAHIAGTNGKGSATAMLANIIQELGYKTGRFISPYIYEFTERVSVNGLDISRDDIILYTEKIRRVIKNIPEEYKPNAFQFTTLLAFLYYKDKNCDIAVLETGLGGRIDPTNILKSPLVSVIMQIGMDHAAQLGSTVEQIAREKCGIIKENGALVLYPANQPSVINIAEQTAREKNSIFIMPDLKYLKILDENIDGTSFQYKNKDYALKLLGEYQVYNALTVIEAADYLFESGKIRGSCGAIYTGIKRTRFPARLEILSRNPLVIFDGAHNIPAVVALRETIKNLLPDKKIILICGMLKDKEPENIIKNIAGESFVDKFIAVPVNLERAEAPENLRGIAAEYCANVEAAANLNEGLAQAVREAARDNLAVICFGSLYLAADLKRELENIKKRIKI